MRKTKLRKRMKRVAGLLMAACLVVGSASSLAISASAADLPDVSYDYSEEVHAGTIRYISQNDGKTNNSPRSSYFDDRYWGDYWLQPHYDLEYSGPGYECGTASISMALSYVGINQTPQNILDAHNGQTYFEGWGAELQQSNLTTAVERYVSGEGKYSPPIIHFMVGSTGYPSGHYVLVVGQNSNGGMEILDCNRDSIWTLETGDYLYGRIDSVYQYYNANAVIEKKNAELPFGVTPVKLTLEVTRKSGSVVRSAPGNKETITGRLKKGAVVTAAGYTQNKWGNTWFYLEDGTYVFSNNVKVKECLSTASISGVSAPTGNLTYGGIYVLKGTISSELNTLTSVTTTVKTSSGEVVLTATDKVNGQYSLQSSQLDKAMTFNTLSKGKYVFEISVEENADAGVMCMPIHTVLYTGDFTVS